MISTYIFTFIFIHFKRKNGIYQLKKAFSISKKTLQTTDNMVKITHT